jgi:hypothetical protein
MKGWSTVASKSKVLSVPGLLLGGIVIAAAVAYSGYSQSRNAEQPRQDALPVAGMKASDYDSSGPGALLGMVQQPGVDTIVVGTVSALSAQYRHYRDTTTESDPCQRVYSFSVEQCLLGSVPAQSTISVVDHAGATINGVTYRYEDLPWLVIGTRYILVLTSGQHNERNVSIGYVQDVVNPGLQGEFHGKLGELSDYFVVNNVAGVVKLSGGMAVPNSDGTYTNNPTQFDDFPVWNQTEATAIASFQSAIAQDESMRSGP